MESKTIKVLLNDKENPGKRKEVDATLLGEGLSTITVRLPDGNVIKRKKKRDLPG